MFLLFGNGLSEKVINVVSFVCGFCGADARPDVTAALFGRGLSAVGTRGVAGSRTPGPVLGGTAITPASRAS